MLEDYRSFENSVIDNIEHRIKFESQKEIRKKV